jgi:hypothetical protein
VSTSSLTGRVLQHVAGDTGVQGASQVAATREGRHDHDACRKRPALHLDGDVQAGASRHLDVGQQHVGSVLEDGRERRVAVRGGRDDLDVRLEREQRREGTEHHPLVLGQHGSDRHREGPSVAVGDVMRTPPGRARSP